MKTKYYFLAALATAVFASCTSDEYVGDVSQLTQANGTGAIEFSSTLPNRTRAGEFVGATAAEKLGGMFVVEGTKGSEQATSPSTTVVFDNYLVGYTYNSAGTTESNTNNWEYVGLQTGITGRMTAATWNSLHEAGPAKSQTIKYWDYSTTQYDFYAYSTGTCLAVPVPAPAAAPAAGQIQVSRINQVTTAAPTGFTMRAASASDLKQCYYTDINTVLKANYGHPVTLTFRNMTAKVRIALYETVPGYSVKAVEFFQAEAADPTAPADLATNISSNPATLFTTGSDKLPQSGIVTVLYPRVGTGNSSAVDHNKASVTVEADASSVTTQTFGTLTAQYVNGEGELSSTSGFLGRTLPTATFAGSAAEDYYQAVIPNTNGKPLTLRVNYTLKANDGTGEEIKIYGAKAVVPATYTNWLPNYAYTYIFKISDNTNGWTDTGHTSEPGLFPITFDAVVTSFVDVNAEQTTVTTVATPSITTYQQGHTNANNEYSKSQTAGASGDVKDLYVQVMDNSGATPTLKADLNDSKKSRLYKVSKDNASEAEVMDALQNRTNRYTYASALGRNGVNLGYNTNIDNTVTSIINGVDDQPITKIAGTDIVAGQVAKIDIDALETGTYAYVYSETVPSADEVVYNVAFVDNDTDAKKYYEVDPASLSATSDGTAAANKVYFVANRDAQNTIVSYTFVQTKVGESVTGLYEATIDVSTAAKATSYTAGHFYFDIYYQNNGAYAVKVFKVVG